MANCQTLPQEVIDLVATQVPREVYIVITKFLPNRRRRPFGIDHEDQTEMIGTFSTLELANRAAELFVRHKVKPFIDNEPEDFISGGDCETEKETYEDGTMKWTIYPKYNNYQTIVETWKQRVRWEVWGRDEMPLPLHSYLEHNDNCPCCNTAEEIRAAKAAEAEAEEDDFREMKQEVFEDDD